ncbi:FeoA family protein [Leptolyngbya ohadii]|uniref:FeoA family protein n=1 Tax=Leptolyngbya ohadii TaxID=1962290 RepID=UPI001CEDDDC4|nr:FeoA family protein [Leptolyngbya ohadii]
MLTTGFSVKGASLKLLHPGEQGVITRINAQQDTIAQNLRRMGLVPGQKITLTQRFPRFMISTNGNSYALDEAAINALYVRVVDR